MTSKSRDAFMQEIADNVTALTVNVTTTAHGVRAPGAGADGVRRRAPEDVIWRLQHLSLLHQLLAALTTSTTPDGEPTGGTKPGSRPPVNGAASNALDAITNGWPAPQGEWWVGVYDLQAKMRRAARRGGPPRRPLIPAVEDVRALAHVLPDPWPEDAAKATGAWVTQARSALALDARMATLRDVRCPYCQTGLQVRSDGSSDVWCPNPRCRDEQGGRYRWARAEWPFLLERVAGRTDGAR